MQRNVCQYNDLAPFELYYVRENEAVFVIFPGILAS